MGAVRRRIAAALFAIVAAAPAGAAAQPEVFDLPTRPGVTLRVMAHAPARPPVAAAILLAGGDGVVAIPQADDPDWQRAAAPPVRIAPRLAARGLYAAVVDAPSDQRRALSLAFRGSTEHAADLAAVIAALRARAAGAPVWLVGHSSGAVSAATLAARLPPPRGPAGLVLLSTVWEPVRMVAGAGRGAPRLADIAVPTLLVHNRADRCTPLGIAEAVRGQLPASPRVELLTFDGPATPEVPGCARFSAHGFLGIEEAVAAAIVAWIAR